jgi:hypothetical protein
MLSGCAGLYTYDSKYENPDIPDFMRYESGFLNAARPFIPNYGYRPGDPCIKCGENFEWNPNSEFAAQRQKKKHP